MPRPRSGALARHALLALPVLLTGCQPCSQPTGTYTGEISGAFTGQVRFLLHHIENSGSWDEGPELAGPGTFVLDVPEPRLPEVLDADADVGVGWDCDAVGGSGIDDALDTIAFRLSTDGASDERLSGSVSVDFVGSTIQGDLNLDHWVEGSDEELPAVRLSFLAERE